MTGTTDARGWSDTVEEILASELWWGLYGPVSPGQTLNEREDHSKMRRMEKVHDVMIPATLAEKRAQNALAQGFACAPACVADAIVELEKARDDLLLISAALRDGFAMACAWRCGERIDALRAQVAG